MMYWITVSLLLIQIQTILTFCISLSYQAPLGPPFALVQGTLESQGIPFKQIPIEVCPYIKRGSVAWVGSGPEFFISLADHQEWSKVYTVFGSVLPEDMEIAEKIAQLPTKPDVWNNINVSVLQKPVSLRLKRMKKSHGIWKWNQIGSLLMLVLFHIMLEFL